MGPGFASRLRTVSVPTAIVATIAGGAFAFSVSPEEPTSAVPGPQLADSIITESLPKPNNPTPVEKTTSRVTTSRSNVRPASVTVTRLTVVDKTSQPGRQWTTQTLRLRSQPDSTATVVATVPAHTELRTTGVSAAGWQQVKWKNGIVWASSQYLTASDSSSTPSSDDPPSTGGSCRHQLPGLTARAKRLHNAICARFPSITTYHGVRPDPYPAHPEGRAIDAMTRGATGDELANWLRAHASEFHLDEIIWNQRIWTAQRSSEGWRSMSDRGGDTANHRDHVHVAVKRG